MSVLQARIFNLRKDQVALETVDAVSVSELVEQLKAIDSYYGEAYYILVATAAHEHLGCYYPEGKFFLSSEHLDENPEILTIDVTDHIPGCEHIQKI